jgi:hypothetical protein
MSLYASAGRQRTPFLLFLEGQSYIRMCTTSACAPAPRGFKDTRKDRPLSSSHPSTTRTQTSSQHGTLCKVRCLGSATLSRTRSLYSIFHFGVCLSDMQVGMFRSEETHAESLTLLSNRGLTAKAQTVSLGRDRGQSHGYESLDSQR